MIFDPNLISYAKTDLEKKYFNAVLKHGSQTDAAKALNVTINAINKAIKRLRVRAAENCDSPEHNLVNKGAPGFGLQGYSMYHPATPDNPAYWAKFNKQKEDQMKALAHAVDAVIEPCRGLALPVKPPKITHTKHLALYPIAEPHLGMYAYKPETGSDYDVEIAETLLIGSMRELVDSAPDSEECVIANLADYFHMDSAENKTKQSGNILDVDGRWGKVFWVGVRVKRAIINMALKKHKRVKVISGLGNHDEQSIFCLMSMMKAYFENDPRVEIVLPHNPFAYHQYGQNLIGLHHGDRIKPAELPMIMAADQAVAWGQTIHRHFLRGHIHHKEVKEYTGCTVESFRSIAAKDNWHNASGYRAGRGMECIVYDQDGGEYGRRIVNIKG